MDKTRCDLWDLINLKSGRALADVCFPCRRCCHTEDALLVRKIRNGHPSVAIASRRDFDGRRQSCISKHPRLLDGGIADVKYYRHLDCAIVGLRRRQALPL